MKRTDNSAVKPVCICLALAGAWLATPAWPQAPNNLILFVPDGLRSQIVDEARAPGMARLRAEGVDFRNSHALFPTFTTANASALATGHGLGDTGDFSNLIYTGVRMLAANATVTPFLENNPVLRELNSQFGDNYLHEEAVVAAARAKGYGTALIGKLGPTAIFDMGALTADANSQEDGTLVVDDATGTARQEVPLSAAWKSAFAQAKIAQAAPGRGDNAHSGDATHPGTRVPNLAQQQYFLEVALKVALPRFQKSGKPFVMVFWSRDPDGTQHNQGDSFHALNPGINGPASLAAIRNADSALELIEATLKQMGLYEHTNIIVAADHGFSTIVKTGTNSPLVQGTYRDVKAGELPLGFMAIDLHEELRNVDPTLKLFDPDAGYRQVDWRRGTHPARGNGLIGVDADHPKVVVVANGGSDLIYLPPGPPVWQRSDQAITGNRTAAERRSDRALAQQVVTALLKRDYVSGVFVNARRFGSLPGTLSLEDIGLEGGAITPRPDIVVSFASRPIPGCELAAALCAGEIADTSYIEGQGMHGSFSRADTWNFMAARGPDFKAGFVDPLPASNADIGMTMAQLLGLAPESHGTLRGRVLSEALRSYPPTAASSVVSRVIESSPGPGGVKTIARIQVLDGHTYIDAAGFAGRTVGLDVIE